MRSKRRATPGRGEGPCRQHDVTFRVTAQTRTIRLTRATLMREDAIHEEGEKKMVSNEHTWFGWHFSDETERLRYGDGRKIAVGVTHTVECELRLCESGLHASACVLDALQYAPGHILWRVSLGGEIVHGDDKSCATQRTYHVRLDAENVLKAFARRCALQVIHLLEVPQVIRDYLETGDENLRDAARAAWAASAAARDAQKQLLEQMVSEAIAAEEARAAGGTTLRRAGK